MHIELARLRPAYNGTALAAGILAAPAWANLLTDISHTGDGTGPLGATAIAATAALIADRTLRYRDDNGHSHGIWIPRAALFTTLVAPACSLAAARPTLAFLTGGIL
ncbi:hypothetical protein P3T27_006518 [Kitasatospora sp. MAA19]|uniref:hypothetical protein n=1 Tax=Kitasatospora sp. MAA19 TaxID=3035090 RepID=UPI0024731DC9|nr:hypothetical protein [Kitasatospora sp. MAA19]MDH6709769.1 hypothetical protein [Kitasatospora sp. MAA19]